MALTLDEEQKLQTAGLDTYLANNEQKWVGNLKRVHTLLTATLPKGTVIRPDDVAKLLLPITQVDKPLQAQLAKKRLKPKYWYSYFTNLVIERLWAKR